MTIETYLSLITSQYADQPNFLSTVAINVSPMVRVQELLNLFITLFDIDTPPVGDQLDIIGKWVGVSRTISVPISGNGIWFSWDDNANDNGWDLGSWQPSDGNNQITVLPDDAFLTLIRAKIGANSWDGTTEGAYAIYTALFPDNEVLIQDYGNMSYAIIFLGPAISPLDAALFSGGYVPLKPEGVQVTAYYRGTPPIFSWDQDTTLLKGWDQGNWAENLA